MAKKAKQPQMTEQEIVEKMRDEIRPILNKYEFVDVAITGEFEKGEKKWWALYCVDKPNVIFLQFNRCAMNIARMYQATRDKLLTNFDRVVK